LFGCIRQVGCLIEVTANTGLTVFKKCHYNFQTSELGSWEEQENAWDAEEGDTDLTWEADNMIQEKRRQERQQRQQQHARRKLEKDQQRQGKQSSLAAVKLS